MAETVCGYAEYSWAARAAIHWMKFVNLAKHLAM